jgi:hypothetical protein
VCSLISHYLSNCASRFSSGSGVIKSSWCHKLKKKQKKTNELLTLHRLKKGKMVILIKLVGSGSMFFWKMYLIQWKWVLLFCGLDGLGKLDSLDWKAYMWQLSEQSVGPVL